MSPVLVAIIVTVRYYSAEVVVMFGCTEMLLKVVVVLVGVDVIVMVGCCVMYTVTLGSILVSVARN